MGTGSEFSSRDGGLAAKPLGPRRCEPESEPALTIRDPGPQASLFMMMTMVMAMVQVKEVMVVVVVMMTVILQRIDVVILMQRHTL